MNVSYYRGDAYDETYGLPASITGGQETGSFIPGFGPGYLMEGPYVRRVDEPSPYGTGLPPLSLVASVLGLGSLVDAYSAKATPYLNKLKDIQWPITAATTTEPSGATSTGETTGSVESALSALISLLRSGISFPAAGPRVGPETPDSLSQAVPGSALQDSLLAARRRSAVSPRARRSPRRVSSKPPRISSAQARALQRQLNQPRGFTG